MNELFSPEYVHPEQAACPDCGCCTTALCARGRVSVHECRGLTAPEFAETVYGCPCSSSTTHGTHAWRADRIRVTRLATESPFPTDVEVKLRALADTGEVTDETALAVLRVYGLTHVDDLGTHTVTDLGRLYLTARRDARFMTPVEVLSIDVKTRTASVIVIGWHLTEPVTVLMDQLITEDGPDLENLPGTFLEAEANCRVENAEDIVLTKINSAPPLPDGGWITGDDTVVLREVFKPGGYVPVPKPLATLAGAEVTPEAGRVDGAPQVGGAA